jgi:hypothetical protein
MANCHKLKPCPAGCGKQIRAYQKGHRDCAAAGAVVEQAAAEAATTGPADSLAVSDGGNAQTIAKVTRESVRTLEDLIRVCEIDTAEWRIVRWVANKWEVGAKNEAGELISRPLFQVKVWLQRNAPMVAARSEVAALIAEAKQAIPARPRKASKRRGECLLEVNIPDLHVGKLAWSQETGWENYDSRIAERVYEAAIDAVLERTAGYDVGRVLYVVGNDLLHSDTKQGTTTGGTPLDTDSRFQKSFAIARQLTTRTIERLRERGPVEVKLIPGNHDTLAVWHLGDSLECFFHRTPDVSIDNEPKMRKYVQHGLNMIMLTHGNRGKLDRYPSLMAAEQPRMWGATRYREAHTGDKHQHKAIEVNGVKVRILSSLSAADAWHSEMMFVGNARSAEALVFHPVEGWIGSGVYTVPNERAESA